MEHGGPFVLHLRTLEEGRNPITLTGSALDLGITPHEARVSGAVVLRADVWKAGTRVEIQGMLTAELELICDRCLEPVIRALSVPVRLFAERQESRDRRSSQEVREEDLGIVYHDGQNVALAEELRQELLVEVPWHVLCKEDCLGLCPRCGVNRNTTLCSCSPEGGEAQV